jgi:hypothetical protein
MQIKQLELGGIMIPPTRIDSDFGTQKAENLQL